MSYEFSIPLIFVVILERNDTISMVNIVKIYASHYVLQNIFGELWILEACHLIFFQNFET